MNVDISIWGVIVSAVAAMVIGTVWYSPGVFGKPWMKMIGLSDKEMKRRANLAMAAMVVVSLVTAYVLSLFIVYQHAYSGQSWVNSGWETAFLAWLGIGATAI